MELERRGYLLLTLHRQETVEYPSLLREAVAGVLDVAREMELPIVASVHPRTRERIAQSGLDLEGMIACEPFGLADFVCLERHARLVLTDSGTVQEVCCL